METCYSLIMISYRLFTEEAIKLAEEKVKRTFGETVADISPWILGFSAGNLAGSALKTQLSKIHNPQLKTIAKVGVPLAGGALSYMVLPKLQAKWKEALTGQKPSPKQ